jgi:hypothetical protein
VVVKTEAMAAARNDCGPITAEDYAEMMNKSSNQNTFSYTFANINRGADVFPETLQPLTSVRLFCVFEYAYTDEHKTVVRKPGIVLAQMVPGDGKFTVHDFKLRPEGKRCRTCSEISLRPVYHEEATCQLAQQEASRLQQDIERRCRLPQPDPGRIKGKQVSRKRKSKAPTKSAEERMSCPDLRAALTALGVPMKDLHEKKKVLAEMLTTRRKLRAGEGEESKERLAGRKRKAAKKPQPESKKAKAESEESESEDRDESEGLYRQRRLRRLYCEESSDNETEIELSPDTQCGSESGSNSSSSSDGSSKKRMDKTKKTRQQTKKKHPQKSTKQKDEKKKDTKKKKTKSNSDELAALNMNNRWGLHAGEEVKEQPVMTSLHASSADSLIPDERGDKRDSVATSVQLGENCGFCRVELNQNDAVLECNSSKSRKGCEHAYHVKCVIDQYKSFYPATTISKWEGKLPNWIVPTGWKCPSCTLCIKCNIAWSRRAEHVVLCQHCSVEVHRTCYEASEASKLCCFCLKAM